ncbi:glycoside hydrolase family 13 protein [Bacillus taeanensis]|uniref:Glucohydrolase n=1 Tax=Bacillus taeanensis TaxID=273032 RepID=A0A366Y4C4_9BACI|nr:alpha-glucosidase [Bacillus taeanensis]RBW71234.1 glucohydrolase [Bacillus taeanensis]
MNKNWWKESVVYQIYPRSFKDSNGDGIGDLNGIISKLDYLKDLGIDMIWVCPIYKSPNDDNGYDISDYQDIMDEFGTMEEFDQLLEEVHKRDMKLIMDLVVNHTSDEHPWFVESRQSKENRYRDYYIWSDGKDGKDGKEPNNWESIFSGSAWQYDEATNQYYMHVFSKKQPDLNWENESVRQDIYQMINWWLDKGIDGFRVDAISHIKKATGFPDMPNPHGRKYVPSFAGHMNQPGIHTFLEELKEKTFANYDIMTVGEANGVSIEDVEKWVGEKDGKFNMIFQFEHMGLWDYEDTEGTFDIVRFKDILSKWQKGLENRGWNALYLENHDQPRSVSQFGNDTTYLTESAKALAACYFFMQGTPYIYQGQEIGMTNVQFPSIEDYRDVGIKNLYREWKAEGKSDEEIMKVIWKRTRDNSRTPMQWTNESYGGFSSHEPWIGVNPNYKEINAAAQQNDPHSILNFYKKMIKIRKENDVFVYGTYDLIDRDNEQVYTYTRTLENQKAVVMCNLTENNAFCELNNLSLENSKLLISNYKVNSFDTSAQSLELKPFETRVYLVHQA